VKILLHLLVEVVVDEVDEVEFQLVRILNLYVKNHEIHLSGIERYE